MGKNKHEKDLKRRKKLEEKTRKAVQYSDGKKIVVTQKGGGTYDRV